MWHRTEKPKSKSTPGMIIGQRLLQPPQPALSFNPEVLAGAPQSALELLQLQGLYGNRGAERILNTMEAAGKSDPVIQGVWEEDESKRRFEREDKYVKCESWKQPMDGKLWYRYKSGAIWFYSYNSVDSSDDDY